MLLNVFWWKYNYYKFLTFTSILLKNRSFTQHKIIIKMNYLKIYLDNFILTKFILTKFDFIKNRFFITST
jgi:hypothetical protein